MTEHFKENIKTLKRSFVFTSALLILLKMAGLFLIDIYFGVYIMLGISILWIIVAMTIIVMMYTKSFYINYEKFFILAIIFHFILLSIVNVLFYNQLTALASEYILYTIIIMSLASTNRALLITLILVVEAVLSFYIIPIHYKIETVVGYLETESLFLVTINIIIGTAYLYFLVHIKQLEAIILYIENKEFNLDKLGFYRPKLLFGNYKDDLKKSSVDGYKTLYNQIEEYMRLNQPWLDPEYSIEQLAREMKTNTTYISQSINIYAKANFRAYINQYRLNRFIQVIDSDEKLSIRDAYINSGFNNQATFNRVFKNKYNDNPQEYIENLHRKKIEKDL